MEIEKLNQNYNFPEWDELLYDYWEAFQKPQHVTPCEAYFARVFMETMRVDYDREYLITFRAAPEHFGHLIINFIREMKSRHSEKFAANFCKGIEGVNEH